MSRANNSLRRAALTLGLAALSLGAAPSFAVEPLAIRSAGADCYELSTTVSARSFYRVEVCDDLVNGWWREVGTLPSLPNANTIPIFQPGTGRPLSAARVWHYPLDTDRTAAVTIVRCALATPRRFWRIRSQSLDEPLEVTPCPVVGVHAPGDDLFVRWTARTINPTQFVGTARCRAGHEWSGGTNEVVVSTDGVKEYRWPMEVPQ